MDTLDKFINKFVLIETDQSKHKGVPYVGLLTGYDKNLIELKDHDRVVSGSMSAEDLAGSFYNQRSSYNHNCEGDITLGRDVIATIKDISKFKD